MNTLLKKIAVLILGIISIGLHGCVDKTFFPPAEMEVTSVEPYRLLPTATDTASLPGTSITIQSLNAIPSNLRSFSISYKTALGEPIVSAQIRETPIDMKLDANQTLVVEMNPYTSRIVDLFELSLSEISPILAEINLNFKDINGNWVSRQTSCLLYKP